MDVTGDGLPDILKSNQDGSRATWKILRNTGSSWSTTWEYWLNNADVDVNLEQPNARVMDVTGDGLPDILKSNQDGSRATWKILRNTGSSWSTTWEYWLNNADVDVNLELPNARVMDVTGDGLPDILKSNQDGSRATWKILRNTGSSWSTTWEYWLNNADVDVNLEQPN